MIGLRALTSVAVPTAWSSRWFRLGDGPARLVSGPATAPSTGLRSMHPAYFETRFRTPTPVPSWPGAFAIVTAYATTGESWSDAENERADLRLEEALADGWRERITGYSPTTGHAEPGWAVALPFDDACDLGERFRQDAVYLVEADDLFVSYCDGRRALVRVGSFRERLDHAAGPDMPTSGPAA
jgi:hypothetical protein